MNSTHTQSQLCTATPVLSFVPRLFNRHFLELITLVQWNELIYMVFTTKGLFEVAIESWPEWDLNPHPLNNMRRTYPTRNEVNKLMKTEFIFSAFIFTSLIFHYLRSLS